MNLFVGGHFLEFVKCKYSAGGENILRKDYSSALIFGILENVLVNGFVSETVFLFRCPRDLRNIHCMFFYWGVSGDHSKSFILWQIVFKIYSSCFENSKNRILNSVISYSNGAGCQWPHKSGTHNGSKYFIEEFSFFSATSISRDIFSTSLLYS